MTNKAKRPTPAVEAWRDNFKSSAIRVGLSLSLTRAMCEFLSAVADDVTWDRCAFGSSQAFPDNFLATSRSLERRGLVEQKSPSEIEARKSRSAVTSYDLWSWSCWRLTPAGELVVGLLKLAGLFVEADIATEKKAREESAR